MMSTILKILLKTTDQISKFAKKGLVQNIFASRQGRASPSAPIYAIVKGLAGT